MCNPYNQTTSAEAMRKLFRDIENRAGNIEPGAIYPDRMAPIIRARGEGMVLQRARWGLPSPPQFHNPSGIDRGVTNVRNTGSPHWRRWLGLTHRAPLTIPACRIRLMRRPVWSSNISITGPTFDLQAYWYCFTA